MAKKKIAPKKAAVKKAPKKAAVKKVKKNKKVSSEHFAIHPLN